MKKLVKKVELSFFQDDATGAFGLCHSNTQSSDNGFNAFWDGSGIFHDVFEHSHEHEHKYFKGDFAMNVGGEMAAMGSMFYYLETLGVFNRPINYYDKNRFRNYNSHAEVMRNSTESEVIDAIAYGNIRYGSTLESNVPQQKPVHVGDFEYEIAEYWKNIKAQQIESNYPNDRECASQYKESVTFRKIADLHRYGYRMAERMVPDNWDNRQSLVDFIEVWHNFTQRNNAEEMHNAFKGLTFYLYKENNRITWKAKFFTRDRFMYKNVTVTPENISHFYMEDIAVY